MMDSWNPNTFNSSLRDALTEYSDLICSYHEKAQSLMDDHLHSDPYQSLKENPFSSEYMHVQEEVITPLLTKCQIRVWHYTRLVDDEVNLMRQGLESSSLSYLRFRLENLVAKKLLTQEEAEIVYNQSPFHTQLEIRAGRLWCVNVPLSSTDYGVMALLESWGGESAYFRLKNEAIATKLKHIGFPRIVEIETVLFDELNAYKVSNTVMEAWAKSVGINIQIYGCDLSITGCIETAKVIRVHTQGDELFNAIAKTYPENCLSFLE